MNWYIIVSIVSSFLLGWGIGIWYGTSKGYEAAQAEYQEALNQEEWMDMIKEYTNEKR
jgi:hypothetical protein